MSSRKRTSRSGKNKRASAKDGSSNIFCSSHDLSNEASVESFFVLRLLEELGYRDSEIRTKAAIAELLVGKGRKKQPYRPDFLIFGKKTPRWVIDAKSPGETPDDYVGQGAGYCLGVNQKYEDNPVQYFVLTNGFLTRVFRWDKEVPIMSLRFGDFANGSPKYESLKQLLGASVVRNGWQGAPKASAPLHKLVRPGMEEVKRTFYRCHRIIWKAEKVSPQAAFLRFAKILFVKLWEDRRIRDNPAHLAAIGRGDPLPGDAVRFSSSWIEQQELHEENPADRMLFRQLVESLEAEIQARSRKRIFEPSARLEIGPGTVKRVVKELEHQYLFGIDEDLNGRMFEAFLVATMRGQDLGQYFTPRSIVRLMTRLGRPVATPARVERVLDGCCGTGGFLIEVLSEMRKQIYVNGSLTKSKRAELLNTIANEAIFGVDAGQDPPLVKIARINMYLHGDGGSRVYMADGLRKTPTPSSTGDAEAKQEVLELGSILGANATDRVEFDLVLTNPPFSMDYSKNAPEEWEVLRDYDLRTWNGKSRTSLRSSVMFLERYYDLLKPGGRLLTVIDDGVLGGTKYGFVRDFIRSRFVINGIISLHGDAFRRAGARTKTSVLCLTKKASDSDDQPDVFVYESRYIGLDDVPSKTPRSVAEKARQSAAEEIEEIAAAYESYLAGKRGAWLVDTSKLNDRLDAKFLNPWSIDQLASTWSKAGASTETLENLVDKIEQQAPIRPATKYTFLRVTYSGFGTKGEIRLGNEISYDWVGCAAPDDIVVSNINAVHGATCVLPESAQDCVVTSEFTVMRVKNGVDLDPMYLWSVLRSPAVIAEWLSAATGLGRHRVTWDLLRHQKVPLLSPSKRKKIAELNRRELALREEMIVMRKSAISELDSLDLYGEVARDKLARAKPPK